MERYHRAQFVAVDEAIKDFVLQVCCSPVDACSSMLGMLLSVAMRAATGTPSTTSPQRH
jgi:hypothetical protein